jgi:phospholipase/lecithinase/hemolysin
MRKQDGVDPSGMNFAVGGAGVVEGTSDAPTLGRQVDKFSRLLNHGIIDGDLADSVALIAFSGRRDYERFKDMSGTEVKAKAQEVTANIADAVDQLMEMGVEKVAVTSLPPLGCTPWMSRSEDGVYDGKCNIEKVASIHNSYLEEKVFQDGTVFNLDLEAAFSDFAGPSPRSKQFKYRLESCCESFDQSGFCGQVQDAGEPQYSVGSKPDKFFYWDDINPTQAGWKAVVKEFEESIKNYLNII